MAELIEERNIQDPSEDGWRFRYRVRRDDSSEVLVEAECSRTAEAEVRSDYARAYVNDRGRAAAIEHAESQPGVLRIRLWVDPLNGSVRADYEKG